MNQLLQTHSGSSQSTPLVAGYLALYLQHKGPEYLLTQAIQDFKEKIDPLWDKTIYGNGMVSVEQLFPEFF